MIGVMTGLETTNQTLSRIYYIFQYMEAAGGRIVFAFLNFLCVCRVQRKKLHEDG
jgi:hypothetical protein